MLSRKAACNTHGENSSYFHGWQEYEKNPYHHFHNRNGMIQMGLAENQLSFDLLESWLEQNPGAAAFKKNGESIFRELALFQDYHGLPEFKTAMAEFMGQIRENRVAFDPKKMVLTAGFDRDLRWRTGVEIVPIKCTSSGGFKITSAAVDEACQLAQRRRLKVKGVLVTNPSNPLGTTLTREELNLLITFISSKGIHLISDEIYAGTVFNSPGFISAMEVLTEKKWANSEVRERVHIVCSLSKDLGLPGFRVGAIYSDNEMVIAAATKMSSFGLVSSQTQHLLSLMLADKIFTENYISENQRRLKRRYEMLVSGLKNAGVSCLKSNAGLFCWVDMRHLLRAKTFEAEMELWKKIVHGARLNISPGSSCHCAEPGWFRVCFANMSEETLTIAMQRLKEFVESVKIKSRPQSIRNYHRRSLTKWVLRLSFDDREPEDR
ncbi:hypothetical protein Nepgr_027033 [Nepenthes gracilis]|uniref:Aminotransferase class I/classII large domain-containing protein n=1 Tax=Nepenthes gracilis TaxID=150966 RepID=A0AAD3T7Z1_NEPGR|nr:hypothetical protein Nepgr_027033 [Nepenthes gracilis]